MIDSQVRDELQALRNEVSELRELVNAMQQGNGRTLGLQQSIADGVSRGVLGDVMGHSDDNNGTSAFNIGRSCLKGNSYVIDSLGKVGENTLTVVQCTGGTYKAVSGVAY